MRNSSETVAATIGKLNNQYFLPAIQREFVWDAEQIVSLFDSILRGYPIGSFLFWQIEPKNRDEWECYRFIEDGFDGGAHNTLANTGGVQGLTMILDGQQRLTSLLIGLKGTYTSKKKYKRKSNQEAWDKRRLYIDLLHNPADQEDAGRSGTYYSLRFFTDDPENDSQHRWLLLSQILDYDSEERYEDFKASVIDSLPESATKLQMGYVSRNLDRLYRAVWREDVISYYIEQNQDYDRVLDIFVRANEGGTKLTKSDLLLSMVTSKWGGTNAREEIYSFVDRLNDKMPRPNDLDKDFVMKSCLVLTDLPVAYRVQNFNNANLSMIQSRWGEIRAAIEKAVELSNRFGLDKANLSSANALIPLAYFFIRRPKIDPRSTSAADAAVVRQIRHWLIPTLLRGTFSGSSDNILQSLRDTLRQHLTTDDSFPVAKLHDAAANSGRGTPLDEYFFSSVLDYRFGDRQSFLALSLLYDEAAWGTIPHHKDHIFPQTAFRWKELEKQGQNPTQILQLQALRDRLGNLQLLTDAENMGKSDEAFSTWLQSRDESYRGKHLIPKLDAYDIATFEAFVKQREALIEKRLRAVLARDLVQVAAGESDGQDA